MVLVTLAVTISTQQVDFKTLDGTNVDFALELEVGHSHIDVVLLKLLEDVEFAKVAFVVLLGAQRTRCVHSVAKRVDVE